MLLLGVCLAGLALLGGCQSEGPDVGVTVGEIEGSPSEYVGERVVVSGDIDDVYRSSFTIGGEGFGGELLVIVPQEAQVSGGRAGDQPYRDDDIVQVVGTVRQYVVADIEDEFGLDLEAEIEYEEQDPTVVAESVSITPRVGDDAAMGQMRDLGGQMQDVQGEGPALTDSVIVMQVPVVQDLVGRQLTLSSVEVREVISDSTFWVGPTGEADPAQRLFVFLNEHTTPDTPTEGRYDVQEGQTISLQGSLRQLPDMQQLRDRLNLSEQTASQLQKQQYYMWAQQASGVDGAS